MKLLPSRLASRVSLRTHQIVSDPLFDVAYLLVLAFASMGSGWADCLYTNGDIPMDNSPSGHSVSVTMP